MNCRFEWCENDSAGHTEHMRDRYTPTSVPGVSRENVSVAAGVVIEEGVNDDNPFCFVFLTSPDGKVDEDTYMSADQAEELAQTLSGSVAIARNPQVPRGVTATPSSKLEEGVPANKVDGPVETAEEVGVRLAPDDGTHTRLAHFVSGETEAIVERYDYKMPDGTIDSEYEVLGNWRNDGCGIADFQLRREDWSHLDDMIAVLTAARRFTRELVAA